MVSFDIQPFNVYIGLAIVGTFTGLGNALGQWLFKEHILIKYRKIKKRCETWLKKVNKQT